MLLKATSGENCTLVSSATFRGSGALNVLTYGNGRRLTMGYDPLRPQPTSMKVDMVSDAANKVLDYGYEYYTTHQQTGQSVNNNRIRKITDNIDPTYTTTYTYDAYNRLERANWTGDGRFYQYDEWGNIKSVNIGLTYHYTANTTGAPATNRLDSVALSGVTQTTFSYDAAGNTTSGDSKTFAYDAVNRLKSVNSGASTYGYDGNGKRVRVTDGGAAVYYVHSSALKNVAMEVTSTGVQRAYVYAGSGKMVAMQATDGQFYWLHTNHLNSSRAMTDVNGNLTYKGQFDPFGQTLSEWSSSGNNNLNSKKFTGYERDATTGLDYAKARMYNSGRGRFMTPDPMGIQAASKQRPQSLNRYSYVSNDPVNFLDPGGTCLVFWNQVGETYGFWDSVLCRDSWDLPMPEMPPIPDGTLGSAPVTNFLEGRFYNKFSSQQQLKLQKAYDKATSTKCQNFFDNKLAEWRNAGLLKFDTPNGGLLRYTMNQILGFVTLNKFDDSLSPHDIGISQSQYEEWLGPMINGSRAGLTIDQNRIFLGDKAFEEGGSFPFPYGPADTAGVIVHELFHAAGMKDEQNIRNIHDQIQANCGTPGNRMN